MKSPTLPPPGFYPSISLWSFREFFEDFVAEAHSSRAKLRSVCHRMKSVRREKRGGQAHGARYWKRSSTLGGLNTFATGAAIVSQFGIYRQRRLLAGVAESSSSFSICTNIVTGRSFSRP